METKTIQCPMHGNPLPLIEKDGKLVAICQCFTGGVKNKWKGQIVYSENLPKSKTKRRTRSKSGGIK